jgi:hypothetical protein
LGDVGSICPNPGGRSNILQLETPASHISRWPLVPSANTKHLTLPKSDRLMSAWYIDTKLHETLLRHTLWWAWQANSLQRLQTRLQRPADITKSPGSLDGLFRLRCGKPKNKPSRLEVIGYYGLPLFGLTQNDPKGCWMGWFMALDLLDYCWRKHLQSAIDKA